MGPWQLWWQPGLKRDTNGWTALKLYDKLDEQTEKPGSVSGRQNWALRTTLITSRRLLYSGHMPGQRTLRELMKRVDFSASSLKNIFLYDWGTLSLRTSAAKDTTPAFFLYPYFLFSSFWISCLLVSVLYKSCNKSLEKELEQSTVLRGCTQFFQDKGGRENWDRNRCHGAFTLTLNNSVLPPFFLKHPATILKVRTLLYRMREREMCNKIRVPKSLVDLHLVNVWEETHNIQNELLWYRIIWINVLCPN